MEIIDGLQILVFILFIVAIAYVIMYTSINTRWYVTLPIPASIPIILSMSMTFIIMLLFDLSELSLEAYVLIGIITAIIIVMLGMLHYINGSVNSLQLFIAACFGMLCGASISGMFALYMPGNSGFKPLLWIILCIVILDIIMFYPFVKDNMKLSKKN